MNDSTGGRGLFAALLGSGDPERPALAHADGRSMTRRDLEEAAARVANALVELGIVPGDRVVSLLGKGMHAVALYLATLRSGAVFVPVNPSNTATEVEYVLSDVSPAVVVAEPDRDDEWRSIAAHVGARALTSSDAGDGSLDARAKDSPAVHRPVDRADDDLAAILFTSGTTGFPKGAMLTHGNLVANARTLVATWRIRPDDVLIHALPLFHTHGLFVGVNVMLLAGASALLVPRFTPEAVARLLRDGTVFMGVPTLYSRLLEIDDLRASSATIRLFISGSAPLRVETHRAWADATGHEIVERYGMTETTMLASNPVDGPRVPGAVGPPLPGVDIRVADADGSGIGAIEVRGPNVFAGYWGMPERTAEAFTDDGFFITGDLGHLDERGYLHIVGRQKELIICGGFNVYPKEVENAIDAIDGVIESAVFGVPDADLGERIVAGVVVPPGSSLDPAFLAAGVATRLARYKRPHDYLLLHDLPRNVMGKIQKPTLAHAYRERTTRTAERSDRSHR